MGNGNWQESFGQGGPVRPSSPSYLFLQLTSQTPPLVWPLETSPGTPSIAGLLNVQPGAAGLSLTLPDATQGATGIISIISNSGSATFAVVNTYGAPVGNINAGEAWVLVSTDNGTPAGAWELWQLGALTSNAQAAALAGAGLAAVGTELAVAIQTFVFNTNQLLSTAQQAAGVIWQGGADGTFQLDAISNVGVGWWALISNQSTAELTISTSGSDTINGVSQLVLPPGGSGQPYSCLVVASSTGFNTFAGTPPIIPIAGGGTGADTAGQALINLGGSTVGIDIFEAPNAAAVLALLGLGGSSFNEVTVNTDQTVVAGNINTAYVCTSAININLPNSTTLSTAFVIAIYAQGGAVAINPVGTDKINGGTVGATFNMVTGSSMLLTTDADGNWWPFFYATASNTTTNIPWCVGTGSGDALVGTYSPPNTSTPDGLLLSVRVPGANTTTSPTFNPDGLGAQPIKKWGNVSLSPNDIPGAGAEILLRWNNSGGWWELVASNINLDLIASTQGDILYRGASLWTGLPPGSYGQMLRTAGAAQNPFWDWEQPGQQEAVASASTTDLGANTSYNNALITGTVGINSFGSGASITQPIYWLEFGGILTITASGALQLPGGASSITTAAGDTAVAEYLGGGNWKIRSYLVYATGEGGGAPPIPSAGALPQQGLFFSGTGGVYTLLSSFGGVSATRIGSGQYSVTLGATPLNIGYFLGTAVQDGSGDCVGFGDPGVTLSAGNTYTFIIRYTSSKTEVDPERCLLLFY